MVGSGGGACETSTVLVRDPACQSVVIETTSSEGEREREMERHGVIVCNVIGVSVIS